MITDLRQVYLFQELPDQALQELAPKLKPRQFNKNHTLIYEEDTNRDVYIIRSGSVKVFSLQDEKEIIFNFFFPGETVGEFEALYPSHSRIASVEAMETVHSWMLTKDEFLSVSERYPSVLRRAYSQLVDHLRVLNRKVVYLSSMDVRRKAANLLVDLYFNMGVEEEGQLYIRYRLTHHILANMIGVTRESLSKVMKEFQDEGLIHMKQKTIYIVDLDRLMKLCEASIIQSHQRKWRGEEVDQHIFPVQS
ncbi:Crp/Fnr family transcriptional regulator [Paenibacillus marinisediminis]